MAGLARELDTDVRHLEKLAEGICVGDKSNA